MRYIDLLFEDRLKKIALVALGVFVLVKGFIRVIFYPLHHDVLWLLYVSEELFRGEVPYVDIVDLNSPFVYIFNFIPIGFAEYFGLASVNVYQIWIFIVTCVMLLFSYRFIQTAFSETKGLGVFVFFWIAINTMLSVYDVGQREHLVAMFVWPYVWSTVTYLQGREGITNKKLHFLAGLAAGYGVFFKPQYLFLIVGLEIFFALRSKNIWVWARTAALGVVTSFVAFALTVFVWVPDYLNVVRGASTNYYQFDVGYNVAFLDLLTETLVYGAVVLVVLFSQLKLKNEIKHVAAVVQAFMLAAGVIAIFQAKGWLYHYFPMRSALGVLVVILFYFASSYIPTIWRGIQVRKYVAYFAWFYVFSSIYLIPLFNYLDIPAGRDFHVAMSKYAEDKTVAAFTTEIYPLFPCANFINAEFVLPYHHFWPLPGFYGEKDIETTPYPYNSFEDMGDLEKDFFYSIVETVTEEEPDVLIIEVDKGKHGFGDTSFDYVEYFSRDERFVQLLEKYEFREQIGGYHEIYTRKT